MHGSRVWGPHAFSAIASKIGCGDEVPPPAFGPYEIITAIGAGGMGEVYRATDTRLGREVAIKSSRLTRRENGKPS